MPSASETGLLTRFIQQQMTENHTEVRPKTHLCIFIAATSLSNLAVIVYHEDQTIQRRKSLMNAASQWRLEIARYVAPIISRNAKVQAIALTGSASRGNADSYSDIEIG